MKVRSSIKKMCNSCQVITRKRKKFIYCKESAKHKQRQG